MKSGSEVAQLCLTLCDPMHCSLLCSPIHGISQARELEWVAIPRTSSSLIIIIILSQVTLLVKNLPANAGDVRDGGLIPGLGRSPVEEGTATHSSVLARRIV